MNFQSETFADEFSPEKVRCAAAEIELLERWDEYLYIFE